jgi:hypothetical protein
MQGFMVNKRDVFTNMSTELKSIFVPCQKTRRDATKITVFRQCVLQAIWSTKDRKTTREKIFFHG